MYHYVYRITNKLLKKHYYGKRSSKHLPAQDLGVKYFSSSTDKAFKQDQKDNPQNYKYKVVKVFEIVDAALALEIKLHAKFKVAGNDAFYNKAQQTVTGFSTLGYRHTPEDIARASAIRKGKPLSEAHRLSLCKPKLFTEATKAAAIKRSAKLKGIPRDPAHLVNVTKAKIKYANIYNYKTHSVIAENICITYWAEPNGYNRRSLQKTAASDHTKASVDANRHHHKGIYARYIN